MKTESIAEYTIQRCIIRDVSTLHKGVPYFYTKQGNKHKNGLLGVDIESKFPIFYLGERENGTGSRLKVGCGIPGKLQAMLI